MKKVQEHIAKVVNVILLYCFNGDFSVRPMKLQKLLFYTVGEHFARNKELIIENGFMVYPYGPVNESVYNYFKRYGRSRIDTYIFPYDTSLSDNEKQSVINTINSKGKYSDVQLSNKTHENNTPWTKAFKKNGLYSKIPDEYIKEYFTNSAK